MIATVLAALSLAAPPGAAAFWSDGKAELAGYRLQQPRYGEMRRGTVVLIFVKEPFSESARVKADPGQHPPQDVFDVLKLNLVKDFQTGVYDYNLMGSVFAAFEARRGLRAGAPAKIVFSVQEWCGAMFEELWIDAGKVEQSRSSYFDGEGREQKTLEMPQGGLFADELLILVRSFPAPLLAPGESREVQMMPSLERARLLHRPAAWTKATLSRSQTARTVAVPAGRFEVETWTADLGRDRHEYDVERAFPHRIIAWRGPDGERGELSGVTRLPYWQLQREGDEKYLAEIGLAVPRPAAR
jgi:hypothetical protein